MLHRGVNTGMQGPLGTISEATCYSTGAQVPRCTTHRCPGVPLTRAAQWLVLSDYDLLATADPTRDGHQSIADQLNSVLQEF